MLKPWSLAAKAERTGSMEEKMVPQSPLLRRNSVTEARIKMVLSARTAFKEASRADITVQSMISAVFMDSREAMLSPVILRRTLASPMMEYILESDIAAARNNVVGTFGQAPPRDLYTLTRRSQTSKEGLRVSERE